MMNYNNMSLTQPNEIVGVTMRYIFSLLLVSNVGYLIYGLIAS